MKPINKAALNGAFKTLKWMALFLKGPFKKHINDLDENGCSPLYLCCYKGYFGNQSL